MKLINHLTQNTLVPNLEKAADFLSRGKGLLGRTHLESSKGLWILNCRDIHTCFMKFPIDAVFLDKKMKVVSLHKNIQPWRFTFSWKASSVVEMPAGKIDEMKIQIGDQLDVVD